MKWLVLAATHLGALGLGFALGVYALPILVAPKGPDAATLAAAAEGAAYTATFSRDLEDSDFLHWGEGAVMISETRIVHQGRLAPGPDYRLYLAESFVETEEQFLALKDRARQVGEIKSFDGFVVDLPADVDPANYSAVVVWCEAFGEFITAAQYR